MPPQQMQNPQELSQEPPNRTGNENPASLENAKTPDEEKPRIWLWIAIILIVFLAISAGIYFWIFK